MCFGVLVVALLVQNILLIINHTRAAISRLWTSTSLPVTLYISVLLVGGLVEILLFLLIKTEDHVARSPYPNITILQCSDRFRK